MKMYPIRTGQKWINMDAVTSIEYGPQAVLAPNDGDVLTLTTPAETIAVIDPVQVRLLANVFGITLPAAE